MRQTFEATLALFLTAVLALSPGVASAYQAQAEPVVYEWQLLAPLDAPPPRYDHVLVAAESANVLVLFGGRDGAPLDDTWIFDIAAQTWREVATPLAPQPRSGMGAVYDAARERVLIFGGQQTATFNDVWAFDLLTETWSPVAANGTPPTPRYGTTAVIDAETDQMLISHGFSGTRFDDTFSFDLETHTWRDVSPAVRPERRCLHEAALDVLSGQMILFGGCSSGFGPCPRDDLWSYDLAGGEWQLVEQQGAAPHGRSNPSLTADPEGELWLFGGLGEAAALNDLWSLDPLTSEWTAHELDGGPSARRSHDATWDAGNGQMFVFGGTGSGGALNDLWVLAASPPA